MSVVRLALLQVPNIFNSLGLASLLKVIFLGWFTSIGNYMEICRDENEVRAKKTEIKACGDWCHDPQFKKTKK